ncbi:MAG: hypothetical protein IJL78_08235 [Lachnospiraceae bacterium]|nr:hypothetical protein [Lachnospiraceae bacterium]
MTIDVYSQYFSADLVFDGVPRHAAIVKLTSDSAAGQIRYTASVSFFPHNDEEDYAVSFDAYFEKELYSAAGRRSKKREAVLMEELPAVIDELAEDAGGVVLWDRPLREARMG